MLLACKYRTLSYGPHLSVAAPPPGHSLLSALPGLCLHQSAQTFPKLLLPAIPAHLPHGLGIPPNTLAPAVPPPQLPILAECTSLPIARPDPGVPRRLPLVLDPRRHLHPETHLEWAAVGTCSLPRAGQLCPSGHSQHSLQLGCA